MHPAVEAGIPAAASAISLNQGHGTITEPAVIVPKWDSSMKARLAPWFMPTSSAWITSRVAVPARVAAASAGTQMRLDGWP